MTDRVTGTLFLELQTLAMNNQHRHSGLAMSRSFSLELYESATAEISIQISLLISEKSMMSISDKKIVILVKNNRLKTLGYATAATHRIAES
jgi:hypothetical protein